ncbi:ERK and JNK pathway, inhibitor domain-containing protein [Ditylenchus destructor]|uniref:ERK and JNK pathway, inhibitor domain-containing protein n=1 Tax=Ditylenchus destructor TaxID=166010 RepID=A0AAD4NEZ7_9BILA|nr:ERK and JNK pathway, inhibitor domain-containing protein [Ditylenchus destructor]
MTLVPLFLILVIATSKAKIESENGKTVEVSAKSSSKEHQTEHHLLPDNKIYEELLQLRRAEQSQAVISIERIDDRKRRETIVKELITRMKSVLAESRHLISQNSSFEPSPHKLPEDTNLKDAVSKVIENVAFLAEITVHFPAIVSNKILGKDDDLKPLLKWAYDFAIAFDAYDESTQKMVNAAAQELSLIPREPEYVNTYEKRARAKEEIEREAAERLRKAQELKKSQKTSDMKVKKKKGPGLSKSEL